VPPGPMAGQPGAEEPDDPFTEQAKTESFFSAGAPHSGQMASLSECDMERSNSKVAPHLLQPYS